MTLCRVNGQPAEDISIADRGLRYGDGVFETLAIVDAHPKLWDEHLNRLETGCQRLGIPAPHRACWQEDWESLSPPSPHGVLRMTVTRGEGGAGYAPPAQPTPNRILQWSPVPSRPAEWWADGVAVRICQTRLAIQPQLAGIKHLNRLEQVLARSEWQDPEIAEGIMCSSDGRLIEATSANLLIARDRILILPQTDDCGVDGIMQQWIAEQAVQLGIRVERAAVTLPQLNRDDGLMLSNSLIGLWPVRSLDGEARAWPVYADALMARIAQARMAFIPEVLNR